MAFLLELVVALEDLLFVRRSRMPFLLPVMASAVLADDLRRKRVPVGVGVA